jgi:hypothetical protein
MYRVIGHYPIHFTGPVVCSRNWDSTVDFLNAAAWDDRFTELLIAHPDDRDRLANLPDPSNLRINMLGPYRNRKSVGLFD